MDGWESLSPTWHKYLISNNCRNQHSNQMKCTYNTVTWTLDTSDDVWYNTVIRNLTQNIKHASQHMQYVHLNWTTAKIKILQIYWSSHINKSFIKVSKSHFMSTAAGWMEAWQSLSTLSHKSVNTAKSWSALMARDKTAVQCIPTSRSNLGPVE